MDGVSNPVVTPGGPVSTAIDTRLLQVAKIIHPPIWSSSCVSASMLDSPDGSLGSLTKPTKAQAPSRPSPISPRRGAATPAPAPEQPPLEHTPLTWGEVWSGLMGAQIRFRSALWADHKCIVTFRRSRANVRQFALTEREQMVFLRTLLGDRQKEIAVRAEIANSTVANCLKSAMLKLGFSSRLDAAPIATLVLSHHERGESISASRRIFSVGQGEFVVATAPSPDWARFPKVTQSEREIAMLIVQGKANSEIAAERHTSPHTVENQVASLFKKLRASGRFDLLKVLYG